MVEEKHLQLPPDITLCQHILQFIEALRPLLLDLNDGFSDWFNCPEHDVGVRLEMYGGIESVRVGPVYYHRYDDEGHTCWSVR